MVSKLRLALKQMLILALSFCFLSTANQLNAQDQSLSDVLKEFQQRYEVYFSYDPKDLGPLNTDFTFQEGENLEEAVVRLLGPLNIKFENINQRFFLLESILPGNSGTSRRPFQASTYQFLLFDEETELPVPDAFIFIENSSIGTNSDIYGTAELEVNSLNQVNIIVTHLNYEPLSLPISNFKPGKPYQLYLRPKAQDIEEVTIKARGRSKRKQWMRRFLAAFYGPNVKKSDIELVNPEVLWFEEKKGTLVAHAIDQLQFINRKSGYEVRFLLENFYVNERDDVRYIGKIFFRDIKSDFKNSGRITRRREQLFLESKAFFFQSLQQRLPINKERFDFGSATLKEYPEDEFSYTLLNFEDLNWKKGRLSDTLFLKGYLAVVHKNVILKEMVHKGTENKVLEDKRATSFLRSKSGMFIMDQRGRLLNSKDIEESGYWADQRFPTELPIDYQSIYSLPSEKGQRPIIDSLARYRFERTPEKIYIHTNKDSYSNREAMWFKAYLVDGITHAPQTKSEVIYVDLISPEGQRINHWMLHRKKGLIGDFQWTRTYPAGSYRLLAYTNYMRNYPGAFFFEKEIEIIDYLSNEEKVVDSNIAIQNSLKIYFFPEGGDLIADLPNNIAFKATYQDGSPASIKGSIINKKGEIISPFKSVHQGYGVLPLTPEKRKSYQAQIDHNGKRYTFPLPPVLEEGFTLQVNASNQDNIYLDINSTDEEALSGAYLVGHIRGVIFCYLDRLEIGKPIQFSKNQIPSGLIHFTLFDELSRPQAERLVFNEKNREMLPIEIGEIQRSFRDTGSIVVPLQLDPELSREGLDISISILNPNLASIPNDQQHISNYLFLNADLSQPIPNPDFYLKDADAQKTFFLDLILMSQTWRRFNWKDLVETGPKEEFLSEAGYTIKGYTTHKDSEQRVQSEILLNSFDNNFIYQKAQTDSLGNFIFAQLPTMDSTTYILQGRINNGKLSESVGKVTVEGNRLLDFHLANAYLDSIPPAQNRSWSLPAQTQKADIAQRQILFDKAFQDDQRTTSEWQIDLDEVTVNARRSFQSTRSDDSKVYNLDAMDWIPPETSGQNLLSMLASRSNYYRGPRGTLYYRGTNPQGQPIILPVIIEIDGMGFKPGGSSTVPFFNLTADEIDYIAINKAYIEVRTRNVSRSRRAYLDSGILQYQHPAYSNARTFFVPDYTKSSSDLRTAIYWNPFLKIGKDGSANIRLKNMQLINQVYLRVEGISATGIPIFKSSFIPLKQMNE